MIDRVGQRLGNYRLLRLLGQGSFSEVYLGEHLHLGTQAAIKVLHVHFTSEDSERLRTEARLIARLAHPLILRILDFAMEDDLPYLIIEYAPGGTLRQRHPKGTLIPPGTIVSYVKQLTGALHYIHEQGWIHRDIKPENMVLGRNNEVLLTDFGLVFTPQSSYPQQSQETAGTVAYIAPEQFQELPIQASDQYALGIVVYEWLSGETPFHGSFEEIASQHLSAPPPSLRARVPTIPPGVEQVVLKALAKDPQQRFANVKDFALALEEAFNTESPGRMFPVASSEHPAGQGQKGPTPWALPTGTVTILFTDIEGSTRLLEQVGDRYTDVLAQCRQLLRSAFQAWNGYEVDTQGDSFFVTFARATDAVLAAVEAQRALAAHPWPEGVTVRVRMGLHTGEPAYTSEGYVGLDVHRAARIMSAAHGGQVLLSRTTANLVEQDLPEDLSLRDLGEHRLKDLGRPRQLFQLVISDVLADFPPLRTLDTYPNNLPTQHTPFIGREQELTAVGHLLSREEVRLVTLTGPGGTGKTRLGVQVAAELTDAFADGVFFVNLAPVSDPSLVVPTIAETLGIQEAGGRPLHERLKEEVQRKQMLLLLDNFEQVVSAAVQVVDLLSTCPRLKVLVTSRETLHVRAEQEFTVPPFPLPDLKHLPDLAVLAHNAAVALFVSRAQAVKPDFQVTNANARALVEICARLDGLPLAIELAAARLKLFSLQALLARLSQRLAVLTSGARDAPARQQTLRNTIAWSYHLLHAEEQQLFRRLSVFLGGCTLEAVEAACQDMTSNVLDIVASLIDKSLLQQVEQEGGEPRYAMLETIREYGLECLREHGKMEEVQRAHALYYLTWAERAETYLHGAQQIAWLGRWEQEQENLRASLQWFIDHQEADFALRLSSAACTFWIRRGSLSEGRRWVETALQLPQAQSPTEARAKALQCVADLVSNQQDWRTARTMLEESVALYRRLDNKGELARSLGSLGTVTFNEGDASAGNRLMEEAIALCRESENTTLLANLLCFFGRMKRIQSDLAASRSLLEEGVSLYRKTENKSEHGYALIFLGRTIGLQGDFARSRERYQEGLALVQQFGSPTDIAKTLDVLARAAQDEGDWMQAEDWYKQSLALKKQLGERRTVLAGMRMLGDLLLMKGDMTQAATVLQAGLTLARELDDKAWLSYTLEDLGYLLSFKGDLTQAAILLQDSLTLARELDDKAWLSTVLYSLGYLALLQGDLTQAAARYYEGFSLVLETGEKELMGWRMMGLAELAEAEGHFLRAAHLLGATDARLNVSRELNPFERANYDRILAAARAQLGEQAFAAAWAEGRAITPEQAFAARGPVIMSTPTSAEPSSTSPTKPVITYPDDLTAREVEVLRLLAQGLTDAQIAEQLVISRRTVNTHLTSIYGKIQVSSRSAATRYAIEHRLVSTHQQGNTV